MTSQQRGVIKRQCYDGFLAQDFRLVHAKNSKYIIKIKINCNLTIDS